MAWRRNTMKNYKIAVAGTGYVGLSIATLLSQHHHVTAVDIVPEKVELINNRKSPIQDEYIEKYLAEKDLALPSNEMNKNDVYAYPNPVKPDYSGLVKIVATITMAMVMVIPSRYIWVLATVVLLIYASPVVGDRLPCCNP